MQVTELADDLRVEADALIALLRHMGIPVGDEEASITEGQVSKVLAKMERERRSGHKDPGEAIRAALEDAAPTSSRRRRRRVEEDETESVETESAAPEDAETDAVAEDEAESDEDEVVTAESQDDDDSEADEAPESLDVASDPEDEVEVVDDAPEAAADESDDEESEASSDEEDEDSRPRLAPARAGAPDAPVRTIRRPAPAPAASAGPGGQVRVSAEGYTADGRRHSKEKKGKKRAGVDQDAVQSNIHRVMAELKGGGGKKRRKKGQRLSVEEQEAQEQETAQEVERERTTVRVNEFLTVAELGELMDVTSTEIIGSAFKNLGLLLTINQRLDFDQIEMVLDEFNFTAVREEAYGAEPELEDVADAPETLKTRWPVVTVMGHVDHGKTLLLDKIRSTNVVAGEAGGITQHIGAYHVEREGGRNITFLDTPGHAAFTAMRARGADVTDIVILIVAADDSVMPQTIEAISHAKNAGVPLIVAINKVDLPAADPGRVKQQLLQHSVNVEDFGGDVLAVEISAKTGQGIDDLLDKVLLQAEMLELKANPDRPALGTVIEAQLDVGKGPVVSVLVQKGTLRVGDSFICGRFDGRVRALLDERGHAIKEAGPATPAQVLGAGGVPQAGDMFQVMDADAASEIATNRQRLDREKQLRIRERGVKLGDFGALVAAGQVSGLPLVIKGDVDGSVQALSDALEQLRTKEVRVEIVHRGVGAINESDVLLAQTAGAVIIGFRVRPQTAARLAAEREDVDIRSYEVIYEAVDDVTLALEGMLAPEKRETVEGTAQVREVFRVSKVGTIAGCYIVEGRIDRKGHARVIRDGIVAYDGAISSLKRFKDDVKEVRESFECGIGIHNYNDLKVGDVIECYTVEEFARTLASSA
ncbi:MAG: translation initiation factor IF-2 [Gemmatimonadetes bacterium]|nr:translation initiation factor IF-2 [Gemmatimonadota bacterium]MDA1103586.1 translation initiation factor IF-2 [Gemmatimonadota bacterium]